MCAMLGHLATAIVVLAAACSHVESKPSESNALIRSLQSDVPVVFTDLERAYKAVLDFFHSKAVEIGDYIDDGDFGEALVELARANEQASNAVDNFNKATEELDEIRRTLENAGISLQEAMTQTQQEVSNNLAPIVNSSGTGNAPPSTQPPPTPSTPSTPGGGSEQSGGSATEGTSPPPPGGENPPPPPGGENPQPPTEGENPPPPPGGENTPPPLPEREVGVSMRKSALGKFLNIVHETKTKSDRARLQDDISFKRKLELLDILRRLQDVEDMQ